MILFYQFLGKKIEIDMNVLDSVPDLILYKVKHINKRNYRNHETTVIYILAKISKFNYPI